MAAMSSRPHIVVMGLMGVGKSTTAHALAAERGVDVHDSDNDLERLFGHTGAQLATSIGVPELHRMEAAVLLGRLAADEPSVIAAAASVVEDALCRDALRRRAVVLVLRAPIAEIQQRVNTGDHRRTISTDELATMAKRRAPWFAEVSNLDLDALLPTAELVASALEQLGTEPKPETPPS